MSPEARDPQTPTQTGSDKFTSSEHPTDGVRAFNKGELHEVAESLPIPNDVSAIHPDKLDVDFEKIPLETAAPAETAPLPEQATASTERQSRKGIIALAGGALTAALAAGTLFGMNAGAKEETPQPQPTAAATPTPGTEATPSPSETAEVAPVNLDELHMLQPGGTAESVQGNFDAVVSEIVNERVDAGIPVSDGSDLRYLVSKEMNSYQKERFDQFIQDTAEHVVSERNRRAENNVDSDISFSLYSTIISKEPTADGFVIVADSEYDAMDSEGMLAGVVLGNLDRLQFTYTSELVDLPNGTQKETMVLSGFESIDKPLNS